MWEKEISIWQKEKQKPGAHNQERATLTRSQRHEVCTDWTIFRLLLAHTLIGFYRPLPNSSIMRGFWLAGKNPKELEK